MAPGKRNQKLTLEDEQRALTEATGAPRSDGAARAIRAALASRRSLVVARAAGLVKRHRLDGFEKELKAAFERFLQDPIKSDPSCTAKLAAIEALDYGESTDPDPFLLAARHVQKEPAWGPPVDTAAGLRSRGVVALARIGYADLELLAAELFTDEEPPVRQAASDALAHRGARGGAALALLKLRLGDEDPLVTLAAMSALVALAPDWGLAALRPIVDAAGDARRELACVALGQARSDDALTLLLDALARCVRPEEREPVLRGIALHRSDRALDAMLGVIAGGSAPDARTAIAALAVRRFEPGVEARVRKAAVENEHENLAPAITEAFSTR